MLIQKHKNSTYFNVVLDGQNDEFWTKYFNNWEEHSFNIFDMFANSNKYMLDFGTWIGPTVLYNVTKFKKVIGVEADKLSFQTISSNIKANNWNEDQVKILNKAIYNESGFVSFGKNLFLQNSRENDSTSQIQSKNQNSYQIPSITVSDLLVQENISPQDIALIKVDIEGGEEFILQDLLQLYIDYKIPLYISLHYDWWKNKESIFQEPLASLLQTCNISSDYFIQDPFGSINLFH
jgi:FkbM family methyltransferase